MIFAGDCRGANTAMNRAEAFVSLFEERLLHTREGDRFLAEGRAHLLAAVRERLDRGDAIELLLPGFPHKSPNPRKVLGALPDRAEESSLRHLADFCREAEERCRRSGEQSGASQAPRVRLTLFSDGRVWGDLVGVSAAVQRAYGAALRAQPSLAPHLTFRSLRDHQDALGGEGPILARVEERWESPAALSALDRELEAGGDRLLVYERFVGLVREDLRWPEGASEEEIEEGCRRAAKRMILRHAAFTSLLTEAYPRHIRLSVHACANAGPKYAVRLYPGLAPDEAQTLPYHGVMVAERDGRERCMPLHRAEALEGGVEVVETPEGRPWMLRWRP